MIGTLGWQELLIILVILGLPALIIALALGFKSTAGAIHAIEDLYEESELGTATPARRLSGYLLETLISVVTLGIGWLIWFAIVAPRGQTPAKQLLGMYILRSDGTRAGGWYVWLREFLIKGLLFGVLSLFTLYLVWLLVGGLWCLWERNRQCLWDKVGGTYVAYSPAGFRPLTTGETILAGVAPRTPMRWSGPAQTSNAADALRDLKGLLDDEIIAADEYEERSKRLVSQL